MKQVDKIVVLEVGDQVHLIAYDRDSQQYSARQCDVEYIAPGESTDIRYRVTMTIDISKDYNSVRTDLGRYLMSPGCPWATPAVVLPGVHELWEVNGALYAIAK